MLADDTPGSRLPDQDRSIRRDLREILYDELWSYRGLAYELMRRDIRVRYKQTILGFAWAVLMPMLIVMAGATVRYAMAYIGGRHLGMPDLAGIAIKAMPWSFFVGSMGFATTASSVRPISSPKSTFRARCCRWPRRWRRRSMRALASSRCSSRLPCSTSITGSPPCGSRRSLLFAFLLTAGLALLVSCANLFFRDVKYLVQVLLTFGIFFTPVFFEPEMFGCLGARVMMLNPLAPIMEGLRLSVVLNHNLLDALVVQGHRGAVLAWSPWYLAYSAAFAFVTFLGGLVVFHRAESKFAEYV